MMSIDFFLTGLIQSLILALIAYAIMIPFRVLHFSDLTAEGAYPLGGAVCTSLLLLQVNPWVAVMIASFVAGLMGVATSLIHVRLRVNTLLSGIILSTMIYSVNLRLLGKPNIGLFNTPSLFNHSNTVFRTLIEQVAEHYKKDSSTTPSSAATAIADGVANDNAILNHATSKLLLLRTQQPQQQLQLHQQQRHVALLFLTIDDLPHEHIWRMWMQSYFTSTSSSSTPSPDDLGSGATTTAADDNNDGTDEMNASSQQQRRQLLRVSVLVHAKYPERIKSAWLKRHHLLRRKPSPDRQQQQQQQQQQTMHHQHYSDINNKFHSGSYQQESSPVAAAAAAAAFHTRRPEWGSIEITRAMIDLLQAGLQIGQVESGEGGTTIQHGCDNNNDVIFVNDTDDNSNSIITPVDRFIFVSESCLPVVTLAELEMALFGPHIMDDKRSSGNNDVSSSSTSTTATAATTKTTTTTTYDKSWINAISTPNNGYALQYQWNAILTANKSNNNNTDTSSIPNTHIWKADQWVMLTRAHASAIISLPNRYLGGRQLYHEFRKCRASDEMYIPTALSILGILHRPRGIRDVVAGGDDARMGETSAGECIRRRRMTYADWSLSAKNPASFTCREWKEVVEKARKEGCLFARKFVRSSSSSPLSLRDVRERKRQGRDQPNKNSNDSDYNDGLISVESWRCAIIGIKP